MQTDRKGDGDSASDETMENNWERDQQSLNCMGQIVLISTFICEVRFLLREMAQ